MAYKLTHYQNATLGTSSHSGYNSREQQLLWYQWVSNDVGTIAVKTGTWKTGTWKAGVSVWPVPPVTKPPRRGRTTKSAAAVSGMSPRTGNPGFDAQAIADAQAAPLVTGHGLETLSDAEIMLRVGAGDDTAFDYLVEKFRRPMVSFMYRMAHNQAVAEELAQEVFLRVYRSRTTYAADAKFTTWLYRIATNLAVNHARDTRQERTADTVCLDEPDEETGTTLDVADKGLTAEQGLLRQERLAAIRKHVMALPERQRMAVLMHKYQDLDYKQIAKVLNLSESATKSLLFRAYESLREKLQAFV